MKDVSKGSLLKKDSPSFRREEATFSGQDCFRRDMTLMSRWRWSAIANCGRRKIALQTQFEVGLMMIGKRDDENAKMLYLWSALAIWSGGLEYCHWRRSRELAQNSRFMTRWWSLSLFAPPSLATQTSSLLYPLSSLSLRKEKAQNAVENGKKREEEEHTREGKQLVQVAVHLRADPIIITSSSWQRIQVGQVTSEAQDCKHPTQTQATHWYIQSHDAVQKKSSLSLFVLQFVQIQSILHFLRNPFQMVRRRRNHFLLQKKTKQQ